MSEVHHLLSLIILDYKALIIMLYLQMFDNNADKLFYTFISLF